MKIVPLTGENVDDAINLVEDIFDSKPNEWDSPRVWMPASLNPNSGKSKEIYSKGEIDLLKYFVGIENGKVIGITGFYIKTDDRDSVWLAWYCVDKDYQGKSYGGKLLDFIIEKAKDMKKKHLKLYASDDEDMAAMKLYNKRGFKMIGKDKHPDTGEKLVYLSLELK